MKIIVRYDAFSNISYKGERTFEVDDQEWEEADEQERRDLVNEAWSEWLHNDVSYDWEESGD